MKIIQGYRLIFVTSNFGPPKSQTWRPNRSIMEKHDVTFQPSHWPMFVVISIPANYVDLNLAVRDYFLAMTTTSNQSRN